MILHRSAALLRLISRGAGLARRSDRRDGARERPVSRAGLRTGSDRRGAGAKALVGSDPDPYRHQVVDVPKIIAIVEEYQLHALKCSTCNTSTRALLPAGVPTGQFGPRLRAIVAVCSGDYLLSKREIELLVEDFFGISIALGSIANLEQAASEATQRLLKRSKRSSPVSPWSTRTKRAGTSEVNVPDCGAPSPRPWRSSSFARLAASRSRRSCSARRSPGS